MSVFSDECTVVSTYKVAEQTLNRLRRVCHSWNEFLLDFINKGSFVTCVPAYWHRPEEWPSSNRLSKARRIQIVHTYECLCDTPCYLSLRWRREHSLAHSPSEVGGLERIYSSADGPLAVTSLHGALYEFDFADSRKMMPNLRILSLRRDRTAASALPMRQLSEAYPRLTHLEVLDVGPDTFDPGLDLPSLTTLSLQPNRTPTVLYTRWGDPRIWNLPSLRYLFIKGIYTSHFITSHIEPLLRATGSQLRGLSIARDLAHFSGRIGFEFPDTIWEQCPNLECIGGTALSLLHMPVPPRTVPVRTVFLNAIFGVDWMPNTTEIKVRETPDIVAAVAKRWPNVESFQLQITWDRFLLKFFHKPKQHRAEWINFLVPFGLFQRRHGCPLRDVNGVAFDDDKVYWVRQKVQMEAVILAQTLPTTSWTNVLSPGSSRVM